MDALVGIGSIWSRLCLLVLEMAAAHLSWSSGHRLRTGSQSDAVAYLELLSFEHDEWLLGDDTVLFHCCGSS